MKKVLLVVAFCCLCISLRAQESFAQLSSVQMQSLGIDQSAIDQLQNVHSEKASAENPGLSLTKVLFANVAGNRQLWRIDFADDFPIDNSNVIFYIDTDNNPQTGRKDVGGTDLMVWVEN